MLLFLELPEQAHGGKKDRVTGTGDEIGLKTACLFGSFCGFLDLNRTIYHPPRENNQVRTAKKYAREKTG
jgi:hypothetical protein